jgi:hypothetical protein
VGDAVFVRGKFFYVALIGWYVGKANHIRELLIVDVAPSSPLVLMSHSPLLSHLCLHSLPQMLL